jgi:RNA polymerase sigma factor (sigma-70 family)
VPKNRLFEEFATYYNQHRCESAPENPRRVFALARRIHADGYAGLTKHHFLSVLYETLEGLFRDFDPAKYNGKINIENHFVNMLGYRLKTNFKRALSPRTDNGRQADRYLFQARPELGLLKPTRPSVHEERARERDELAREKVRDAVERLPVGERDIIWGLYWDDLTACDLARRLKIDRRTVKRRHDNALEKVRTAMAA